MPAQLRAEVSALAAAGDRSPASEVRRALVAHVRRERERMSIDRSSDVSE